MRRRPISESRKHDGFAGWCGSSIPSAPENPAWTHSARSEAPGYFAMMAFLIAYLLNVAGVAHVVQVIFNLSGAAISASYLRKKGAIPSVISNVAWMAITLVGLAVR